MARVLEHRVNVYNSVEITDPVSLAGDRSTPAPDPVEFESLLWHSLRTWKKEARKGVWLKVHISRADLIPAAVRAGFSFHHADPDVVTLTAWLASAQTNKLPPGAKHFVGVAGMVLNARQQVLCIKEKSGPSARLKGFWKLPGGLVDPHEDMRDAVVREVKEETGIDTEFVRLATIQEIHHSEKYGGPARAGTTDLYCICVLRAKDEAQPIVPQEEEIAACQWVDLDEMLGSRYYSQPGTVYYKMYRAASEVALGRSPGLDAENLPFGLVEGRNTLYTAAAPAGEQSSKL